MIHFYEFPFLIIHFDVFARTCSRLVRLLPGPTWYKKQAHEHKSAGIGALAASVDLVKSFGKQTLNKNKKRFQKEYKMQCGVFFENGQHLGNGGTDAHAV